MTPQIAIYIIKPEIPNEQLAELVQHTADQFNVPACTTRLTQELPTGQPVHIMDQLSAKKRDNPDTVYLIVEPKE